MRMGPADLGRHARCRMVATAAVVHAALLAGCAGDPRITVSGVDRVVKGPTSDEYALRIRLENPTGDPLVLDRWNYSLETDAGRYSGEWVASRTLPPGTDTEVSIPAVLQHDGTAVASRWRVNGSVRYLLPGRLAETLFDIGLSKPEALFSGEGRIAVNESATVPTAAPLPGTETIPAGAKP
ncbi:MAG: hypothetical protein FGM37_00550 [Phycisphaerales bacterium]|nr:hypothetical protein [Phycisphaerales bacterium]